MNRIQPEDIHLGDRLWESSQYGSIEFEVTTEPTHLDGTWEWKAKTLRGEVEYMIKDGYEHYGPRIYERPMYFHPPEMHESLDKWKEENVE